jgi:hypothetical protein
VSNEQQFKPRLFIYPNAKDSQTVFDLDDLHESSFVLLCVRSNPDEGIDEEVMHIWKGPDFEPDSIDPGLFIDQVIDKYWGEDARKGGLYIEKVEQIAGDEDEEFLNYFD